MMNIKDIEPKVLWSHFSDLNAIPRPSKKEDRIITFMMNFGQNLAIYTVFFTRNLNLRSKNPKF